MKIYHKHFQLFIFSVLHLFKNKHQNLAVGYVSFTTLFAFMLDQLLLTSDVHHQHESLHQGSVCASCHPQEGHRILRHVLYAKQIISVFYVQLDNIEFQLGLDTYLFNNGIQ